MSNIEDLRLDMTVRYRQTDGVVLEGKIVGIRMNGCVEGDLELPELNYLNDVRDMVTLRCKIDEAMVKTKQGQTYRVHCEPKAVEIVDWQIVPISETD